MAQLIGFFRISSQWACCSIFKYSASACFSSHSVSQISSTLPSSTWIDLLWDHFIYVIYGDYFMLICATQQRVWVSVLAASQSKSIPRPNTLTLPCILHSKLSESCLYRTVVGRISVGSPVISIGIHTIANQVRQCSIHCYSIENRLCFFFLPLKFHKCNNI